MCDKTKNPPWAPYGPVYTETVQLLDFLKQKKLDDSILAITHMAEYMLSELSEPTAHDRQALICLAARIYHGGNCDPAFSNMDWADAIAHFPLGINADTLLQLSDDRFDNILNRMARFKRETYSDLEHTESVNDILTDIEHCERNF